MFQIYFYIALYSNKKYCYNYKKYKIKKREKMMKISFIGAGNVAEAVIHSLVNKLNINDISIFDKNQEQYKKFDNIKSSVNYVYNLKDIFDSEIIFLVVKPNNFAELLSDIKNLGLDLNKKVFVSTGAGITINFIQEKIAQKIAVVRTMPNTPVFAGKGMTALCKNDDVSGTDFEKVCEIFKSMGEIIVLPEEQMNNIIAVNASSPAYIYLFAEAMLKGAVELGFDEREIYPVVVQSLAGSLDMLINSGKMPAELIKSVATPKGTTEKALESFYAGDFIGIVKKAMIACTNRADELTKEYNN